MKAFRTFSAKTGIPNASVSPIVREGDGWRRLPLVYPQYQ